MKKHFFFGASVLLAFTGLIFIQNVRSQGMMRGYKRQPFIERGFKSIGEQIYYTGIGSNGYPIPIQGGPMWLRMHGGGCASCHGTNGKGGLPVMMGTKIPENIRYKTLTGKGYTDALIKRTITQGLEEDGKVMDWTMPRWQMSEADLNTLIEYLKTFE